LDAAAGGRPINESIARAYEALAVRDDGDKGFAPLTAVTFEALEM
jgi:hypothetical protein